MRQQRERERERNGKRGHRVVGGRKKMVGVDVVDPFMQPTYSAEGAQAAESKQPEPDWPLVGADCSTLL